jgi:hypothetical protein
MVSCGASHPGIDRRLLQLSEANTHLHIPKDQKEVITSGNIYCDSRIPCTKEHENQPTMPFAYS